MTDTEAPLGSPESGDEDLGAVRQRLSAAFATQVGEEAVGRCLDMAVKAIQFFGDRPEARVALIERIARNELELLQEGRNERAWT